MMQSARNQDGHAIRAPEWDRQEVAAPYLIALREQVQAGNPLEPGWIDQLLTELSSQLRAVYSRQDVEEALKGLDGLLAHYDVAMNQSASLERLEVRRRWQRIAMAPPVHAPELPPNRRVAGEIDGKALNKSIIPTWLMLVVLSWVSLVWGILIMMPFGVGFLMAASVGMGIVAVPLWATVWGFLGMNPARASTLKGMGFREVGPDHPIHVIAATYARQLDLATPQVGIVDVYNAFAMGTRRDNATIAIGQPLLDEFTPDEIAAIIAHELGHVANGDMRSMMLMRTFQNASVYYMIFQRAKQLARWVVSWAAELLILASSRRREFRADAIAAVLAGKEAMISALQRFDDAPALTRAENTHSRFMIRGRYRGALATHPPTSWRIEALKDESYIKKVPRLRRPTKRA